jgi:hypothetical protein
MQLSAASAAALAQLHEVCVGAARHQWADAREGEVPETIVAALRRAVRAYVVLCKKDRASPEQVLVRLKDALSTCAPKLGDARRELFVREVVFSAFLASYFPQAARPEERSGPLSLTQWATLSEAR